MRLTVIASSSAGNATLIEANGTFVLVDAGISAKLILEALLRAGAVDRLAGICVTHSHLDHSRGLDTLSRKLACPVYCTQGTAAELKLRRPEFVKVIQGGKPFSVGSLVVTPLDVPHDAAEPVAFMVDDGKRRAAVVTDLGTLPAELAETLRQADILLLEANFDADMMRVGPYPWELKMRIMGHLGHLSNEQACAFIRDGLGDIRRLVLGHLSESNNSPELVSILARRALNGQAARLDLAGPGLAVEI